MDEKQAENGRLALALGWLAAGKGGCWRHARGCSTTRRAGRARWRCVLHTEDPPRPSSRGGLSAKQSSSSPIKADGVPGSLFLAALVACIINAVHDAVATGWLSPPP